MKFDFCIGNPPYQDNRADTEWDSPIYHTFMEAAYSIADKTELITPGRFLFNAGKTPKDFNERMLHDNHFKVLQYNVNSGDVFPNVDIKGGVAIHYHDATREFQPIGTFTAFSELNSILSKVKSKNEATIDSIIRAYSTYGFKKEMTSIRDDLFKDLPNKRILASNLFSKFNNELFFENKPDDTYEYVQIYGKENGERCYRWIRKDYIDVADNFEFYKIFIPAANGSGALGEVLSTPVIGEPVIGHNQTFLSMGCFKTMEEAQHCLKYIKSKFARTMLGTLKVTQNGKKATYANIPLQDFTSSSDIDWSKSIPEIDQQLYKKYNLTKEEIDFIESHVKEMN